MKIIKTNIEGLLIIEPDVFKDNRGYFYESFSKKKYKEFRIETNFVQDNVSKSVKGTIRGLHYQVGEKAQGKLCYVISGNVIDVAVDIRFNSPTFGNYYAHPLNSETKTQIWIPPGMAHGFSVLSDEAIFVYKCTEYYSKEHERAILFNDHDLNIDWKVKKPLVSKKDLAAKLFRNIEKDFIYSPDQRK